MNNQNPQQLPPTILENFKHLLIDVFEVFLTLSEEMGRGFGWRRRKRKGAEKSQ